MDEKEEIGIIVEIDVEDQRRLWDRVLREQGGVVMVKIHVSKELLILRLNLDKRWTFYFREFLIILIYMSHV